MALWTDVRTYQAYPVTYGDDQISLADAIDALIDEHLNPGEAVEVQLAAPFVFDGLPAESALVLIGTPWKGGAA